MKYLVLLLLIGCSHSKKAKNASDVIYNAHIAAKQSGFIDLTCYKVNANSKIDGNYCIGYEGPIEK